MPTALPGFEDIKSMVFAGLYTVDSHEHALLRDALEKLRLNDASFNVRAGVVGRAGVWLSLRLSWVCYIWRSSRSGWNASTTWT